MANTKAIPPTAKLLWSWLLLTSFIRSTFVQDSKRALSTAVWITVYATEMFTANSETQRASCPPSRCSSPLLLSLLLLCGLVVSALGIQARGPGFDSWVAPLFHWVATLGKLFTHIASTVSPLQETGVQKGSFRRVSGYGD